MRHAGAKKPQRQCIACRACRDKQDLIRVVKTKEGEIMLDRTGRKMAEERIFVRMRSV